MMIMIMIIIIIIIITIIMIIITIPNPLLFTIHQGPRALIHAVLLCSGALALALALVYYDDMQRQDDVVFKLFVVVFDFL